MSSALAGVLVFHALTRFLMDADVLGDKIELSLAPVGSVRRWSVRENTKIKMYKC